LINAVKECQKLGLRTITLLDTDGFTPSLAYLIIPANDYSISSIKLLLGEFVEAIKHITFAEKVFSLYYVVNLVSNNYKFCF
jgi:ribosomal protein S2